MTLSAQPFAPHFTAEGLPIRPFGPYCNLVLDACSMLKEGLLPRVLGRRPDLTAQLLHGDPALGLGAQFFPHSVRVTVGALRAQGTECAFLL